MINEEPYVDWLQQQLALPLESHPAVVVPLRHRRQLLGVLIVQFSSETVLSSQLLTICGSVGAHMGGALVNAQLHQTLQRKHEHLLRSEQAREQLTQMVAHDLKNPLTVIRGYLTLLQMGSLSSEQQDLVAGADRGSRVLLQLVSDMLDVARLEEGRLELKRSLVEPRVLLESCVDDLRPWIEQDQKVVIVDVPVDVGPLNIDEGLMRRVISNLVSNALKHTPRNTTIRLRLTTTSNNIALQVIDKGPGIPVDQLPHLFTRFGTVGQEGTHQSNTGLGLAFCRLAVDAHGGSISVGSTLGNGSTFTVLLPMDEVSEPLLSAEVQGT
jgi:signal transduction histidine kinase